jgi:hypothetical protein
MQMYTKRIPLTFLIAIVILMTTFQPLSNVQAAPKLGAVIPDALDYLQSQQQPDGGLPGQSGSSDISTTARALMAFKAVQQDPAAFLSTDGNSPIDYVLANYETYIIDQSGLLFPGNAGLVLAALSTSGQAPAELPQLILDTMQPDGSFATEATSDFLNGSATGLSQSLAVLGLAASGVTIPPEAIYYLLSSQRNGLWDNGFGPDLDTSAMAVIALLSSGQVENSSPAIQSTLDVFRSTQLENGGWRPDWDSDVINVDTTGWISLALVTAGQDLQEWSKNGIDPREVLSVQVKEDGSIGGTYVGVYSTIEALLAFAVAPIFTSPAFMQQETVAAPVESRAALVVTMPDGSSLQRCVTFSGASITGFELLQSSGLQLETAFDPAMGPAVCQVEGQGCPSNDCFCSMPDYWSYWHVANGEWGYAAVGAGTFEVEDGTLEGWSWGDTPPIRTSFAEICAENAAIFIPAVSKGEGETAPATEQPKIEPTATADNPATAQTSYLNYLIAALVVIVLLAGLFIIILARRKK